MYKISEVAKQTGLTTATLRYYEQIGLLQTKRKPIITENLMILTLTG